MSKFHCLKTMASQSVLTAPVAHRRNGALCSRFLLAVLMAGVLALPASNSLATSGKWVSTSSSDWAVGANWSPSSPPGTTTTNVNSEVATFKGGIYQLTVLPDANRCIGCISFNTYAANNEGNYIIGMTNGNAIYLGKGGSGYVQIEPLLTAPNVTETINAPMIINGAYEFANLSPEPTVTLVLGDITSGAAAAADISIKGVNTGYNRARGVISDGTAAVGLTKLNAGTWYVSGVNTYTRPTTILQGTLIAAANVPASGAGPFGNNNAAILVGNTTSTAVGDASLLVGDRSVGYTMARPVTVQARHASSAQTAALGGANTGGVSRFTGNIAVNRPVSLLCATGGKVVFQTGTWTTGNKAFTIGRAGYLGTVQIANILSSTGGMTVSNGTLEVVGTLTAAVSVNSGATLAGTGTLSGNAIIAGNGTCAPGTNGVGTLTVNGNVTLQSGSRFTAKVSEAGTANKLTASGTISLDNVVLDVTAPKGLAATVVIAHANTALTGTFSPASTLPAFCEVIYTATEAKLRFTTGTCIVIR